MTQFPFSIARRAGRRTLCVPFAEHVDPYNSARPNQLCRGDYAANSGDCRADFCNGGWRQPEIRAKFGLD